MREYTAVVSVTVPPPPQRLLVFARLPELGAVKSRLAATIGDERTLAVYRAMVHDVMSAIGSSTAETEIEVMWAPTPAADGAALRESFGSRSLSMQTGATLGDRLSMAFSERFFFHRTQKIVATGVDDPGLSREMIDHAFGLLDSCEWTIGPAVDGGYYLIGCRAAAFDPDIFTSIAWGTSTVFAETMAKIRGWGSTVAVLPRRLDIDTEEELKAYAATAGGKGGELPRLLRSWNLTT